MSESMPDQPSSPDRSIEKKKLLDGVTTKVEERIGRTPRNTEKRALGFLMEQHHFGEQQEQTPETFLSSVCGVEDDNTDPRDISVKILTAVSNAAQTEYQRRLSQATDANDTDAIHGLTILRDEVLVKLTERVSRVQDKENTEEVHFSGVPGPWIPAWVPVAS